MEAINFEEVQIKYLENSKVQLSTTCQILDNCKNPIKNATLISSILNNELEIFTDNEGYAKVNFIQDKESSFLDSSKEEMKLIFKISFNASLMIKEKQELQNFPLGDYTFEKLRKENRLYIDKTKYIYKLIQTSKACFISRPRRFGKSLVISTLESLFKGKKELFNGLDIEKENYDFKEYPVIRLDLSSPSVSSKEELNELIHNILLEQSEKYGYKEPISNYVSFLQGLSNHTNKEIIILVDEYDKPVLDNITKENVNDISNELASFFGATKSAGSHIKFLFVTGITKLSNANMFSKGNHITNMSKDADFDSMFGCTQEELENKFKPYIENLAKKESLSFEETLLKIKEYYNGYTFSDEEKAIYNPYSLLHLFQKNRFDDYWFDSGTPRFVLDLMENKKEIFSDDLFRYSSAIFDKAEASKLSVKNVLFQAGYLTVKRDSYGNKILAFPNKEVGEAFSKYFIRHFSENKIEPEVHKENLKEIFSNQKWENLKTVLNSYLSLYPYTMHIKAELYYHSLIHALFHFSGFHPIPEQQTNLGRIDHYIETEKNIFIIEYKYTKSSKKGIDQIIDKKYFQGALLKEKNIHLIGINFEEKGNIEDDILVVNPRNKEELEKFINRK
ncbi:MAG: hypothetical protein COB02_07310 [Candidatus Cloacimonadota bacterium]|nr:MAG: hypothetical protein COB02_07310 [Candidatus Cloacimonadota bacterium]